MKQEIIRINLNGVNSYLGKSERGFVLFDTGGHITMDKTFTDRLEALINQLDKEGCKPGSLNAIVLTHGDNDHVANAAFLREKYQTVIAMHQDDVEMVENLTIDKMMESFRYNSLILKIVFFLLRKPIRKISAKALKDFVSFTPDVILNDGDSLMKFGFDGTVIHLPGHTKGSIGIITEKGEMIAGDTFANIRKPTLAPNAYDFKQLRASLKKLKTMNITTVYPGHGEPFEARDFKK